MALGELNLTPEQFGDYTIAELEAMLDGWRRRYERLEDLFIAYVAMPVYQGAYGKKAPTYKQLTRHRQSTRRVQDIEEAELEQWRDIFNEVTK